MTQENDGFTDPLLDPPRDPLLDPSLDPARERWEPLRVEDAVRRSGSGEAVFTDGSAGWSDGPSRVSAGGDSRTGDQTRDAARETAVPPPPPRELPVIEVSRPATPTRPSGGANSGQSAGSTGPRPWQTPRTASARRQRGVVGRGVPLVIVAGLGLLGFVGVAGLSAANQEQDTWVVGEGEAMPGDVSAPMVEVDVTQLPTRLTVPASPVEIRTLEGGDVSVTDSGCSVEDTTDTADRRDVTVSCDGADPARPVVITMGAGVPLTVVGGKQLTFVGDLKSLAVNGSTADVVVDDLSAESVRVGTSADVTGRIKGATTVDVLSRSGRVDLQFGTAVRKTRIAAPRGEVAVEVPSRAVYDLALRAGKGSVSSAVKDTAGAKDTLAITTGGQHITVTTTP